jgi:hypothetical protein
MALPGDIGCQPIADCGTGTYGNIATDGSTEHVNAAYAGGASDGSAAAPWTSIQQGIDAAADGAVVAVAAGSYTESLVINDKAVSLWGRCPEQTQVSSVDEAALRLFVGASGSTVRGLRLIGNTYGLWAASIDAFTLRDLWLSGDDCALLLTRSGSGGATAERIRIDDSPVHAVAVVGGELAIEQLFAEGSDTTIGGFGVVAAADNVPSRVTLRRALLVGFRDAGVELRGSEGEIDAVAVLANDLGHGVKALDAVGAPSQLMLRDSSIVSSGTRAVRVIGSQATLERVSIDGAANVGVYCRPSEDAPSAQSLTIHQSSIVRAQRSAVLALGCDTSVDATVVRDSMSGAGESTGEGIAASSLLAGFPLVNLPMTVDVRDSSIERTHLAGVMLGGSIDGSIVHSVVRETLDGDGIYGDGIAVAALGPPGGIYQADVHIEHSIIVDNTRTGVATFGSSITLGDNRLLCNPIDLATQDAALFTDATVAHSLSNQGGNLCGCDGVTESCRAQGVDVTPPPVPGANL